MIDEYEVEGLNKTFEDLIKETKDDLEYVLR